MADWLDEMPEVQLTGAVPVVDLDAHPEEDLRHVTTLGIRRDRQGYAYWLSATMYGDTSTSAESALRIDLDHPQGVAYALTVLYQRGRALKGREWLTRFGSLGYRERLGRITDDDRLTLARALREVIDAD